LVEIDGSGAPVNTDGLRVTGSGVTIRALTINRCSNGIQVGNDQPSSVTSNVTVESCLIGTDSTGTTGHGNGQGVWLRNCSSCIIGGFSTSQRNIISGNGRGVLVQSGSSFNFILNNYIGTTIAGTAMLGNGIDGIEIVNSLSNTISNNVISANTLMGVRI